MEIKINYKPEYTSKVHGFSVGVANVFLGYAMQITDPRPRLTDGKLAPGEVCMILLGITKEEFELKDTDEKALIKLAKEMREQMPKDRLIGARVVDLTGKPAAKQVQLLTGESIDGGAFAAKVQERRTIKLIGEPGPIDEALNAAMALQSAAMKKDAAQETKAEWEKVRKNAAAALLGVEKVYSPSDRITKARYPYVRDGRVEVFTTLERAEKVREIAAKLNVGEDAWELKEISGKDLPAYLDGCLEMGLNGIRVDGAVMMFTKDVSERDIPRNGALRGCMLQEVECGASFQLLKDKEIAEPDRRRLLERVLTLQNFTRREMGNSILWAVCALPGNVSGKFCTHDAKMKMDGAPGMTVVPVDSCILISDKNQTMKFLAVFTSEIYAAAFCEKMNGTPHPVAITFDDVKRVIDKITSINGIVVDPESIGFRLLKDQFDKVLDLRTKPPQIVKIAPPKPAEAAAPSATIAPAMRADSLPDPDMGGLPDPDDFDLPAEAKEAPETDTHEENAEQEIEPKSKKVSTDDTDTKKGGFFGRLFGKGKK